MFRAIMFRATALIICLLLLVSTADACPTCKLALEGGSNHSQQGYAYSILFMMMMPFLIAAAWTLFIFRAIRRNRMTQKEFMAGVIAEQ